MRGEDMLERIGARAVAAGTPLFVVESLTGGLLANRFAAAEGSSAWFLGGIVAYARDVKHDLLGVPDGPVVSEAAARAMVVGGGRLLHAALGVAVTGAAGPDPQDGQPPGTVWAAVLHGEAVTSRLYRLAGTPREICEQTCGRAVALIGEYLGLQDPTPAEGRGLRCAPTTTPA